MHAALSLLYQLDQREDDDVSDHLLGGGRLIDVDPQQGKDAVWMDNDLARRGSSLFRPIDALATTAPIPRNYAHVVTFG
jgi:hypothetical protein